MPDDQKDKPTTPTPDDVRFNQLQTYYKDASNKVTWLLGISLTIFIVIAGIVVPLIMEFHRTKTNETQINNAVKQAEDRAEEMLSATKQELTKSFQEVHKKMASQYSFQLLATLGKYAFQTKKFCTALLFALQATTASATAGEFDMVHICILTAIDAASGAVQSGEPCSKSSYEETKLILSDLRKSLIQSDQYDEFSSHLLELSDLMIELKKQIPDDPPDESVQPE